jgi:hypothetical protein
MSPSRGDSDSDFVVCSQRREKRDVEEGRGWESQPANAIPCKPCGWARLRDSGITEKIESGFGFGLEQVVLAHCELQVQGENRHGHQRFELRNPVVVRSIEAREGLKVDENLGHFMLLQ